MPRLQPYLKLMELTALTSLILPSSSSMSKPGMLPLPPARSHSSYRLAAQCKPGCAMDRSSASQPNISTVNQQTAIETESWMPAKSQRSITGLISLVLWAPACLKASLTSPLFADTDVTLSFTAYGDLGFSSENVAVDINDVPVG